MDERETIAWVSIEVPNHAGVSSFFCTMKVALSRITDIRSLGWVVEVLGVEE